MRKKSAILVILLIGLLLLAGCSGNVPEETADLHKTEQPNKTAPSTLPAGAELFGWQGDVAWFEASTQMYGLIHKDGRILAQPVFTEVAPFINGYAQVAKGYYAYGLIDLEGNLVADTKYYDITHVSEEGFALGLLKWREGWSERNVVVVNVNGEERLVSEKTSARDISAFSEGIASFTDSTYNFYVNTQGQIIAELHQSILFPFKDGYASGITYEKRQRVIIKADGSTITRPEWDEIGKYGEGLFPVKVDGKWGYVDTDGNWVIQPAWDGAYGFSNGLAHVRQGDLSGFIDPTGKIVIEPVWSMSYSRFINDRAIVSSPNNARKKFIIDTAGNIIKGPLEIEGVSKLSSNPILFYGDHAYVNGAGTNIYVPLNQNEVHVIIDNGGGLVTDVRIGLAGQFYGSEFYVVRDYVYNFSGEKIAFYRNGIGSRELAELF